MGCSGNQSDSDNDDMGCSGDQSDSDDDEDKMKDQLSSWSLSCVCIHYPPPP